MPIADYQLISISASVFIMPTIPQSIQALFNDHQARLALVSSVSRLAKQVRPLASNDAFYSAFTSGSIAAAQDVFLSTFGLTMES